MTTPRKRCGICERSRPEDETVLVSGARSGNYRTSIRSAMRRVCIDCTRQHVDYTRKGQAEGRNCPLDDAYVSWWQAAQAFGLPVDDLYRRTPSRRIP
jgi:hypothetical protein